MEISQPTPHEAEAIGQVVTSAFDDGGKVAELVRQLSGALIYPEVFWATDSVGLRE